MCRVEKYLKQAADEAKQSDVYAKHGAVIVKGGRVIAKGHNSIRTRLESKNYWYAAEDYPITYPDQSFLH